MQSIWQRMGARLRRTFGEPSGTKAGDPVDLLREVGAAGTEMFAGQFFEEYQPDLRGPSRYDVYTKMRADAQIAALLNVIELPIRAADFHVIAGDESEEGREIAAFVEEAIDGMEMTFDEFLRQAMLMLTYGFMLFEKVYILRPDGRIGWRKFAPRLPKTVARWVLDGSGELVGVEQRTFGDMSRHVTIPAGKLLRFTYREEGRNFEGRALLRDVYKHWWHKDTLYKIAALAAERTGVGIPTMRIPRNAPEPDRKRAVEIVKAFRANEEAGIVLPEDFEFSLTTTRGFHFMPLIEHHNAMIAKAALAQFLNLGQTNVGSFALSQSQTDLFLMTLNGLLQHICATLNRDAIRELVRWNFGEDAPLPELRAKLRGTDSRNLAETLDLLVRGNLLTPGREIERVVRETLDLPPMPESEAAD